MSDETRTKNSIRNTLVALSGQSISMLINFISRSIFINILGANYLGVNGLFSDILIMLSLTELGIGSAITCSMYKPLAEKNENKIKALLVIYATIYRIIGCVIAVLGLVLMPLLRYIIKGNPNIPHLSLIYVMFLANSVITYFFAYKRSIIVADQKKYIDTLNQFGFSIIQNVFQIIILVITKNYILYLSIQIIFSFLANVSISRKANIMYPFLKSGNKEYLDRRSKKDLFKNIGAMSLHKLSGVLISGTDNILISAFIGIYWVGLYSNYYLIISAINSFLSQIFNSLIASVGNLNAKEGREKSYFIFNTLFFTNFWLYGFCSVSLWILFNPFITIWLGNKYVMNKYIVIIIVINFYLSGMRQATLTFRDTLGLFWNDRYKPLFSILINLGASVILLQKLGVSGVFLGTFISTITTSFWVEPYILYKHRFKRPLKLYMVKYVQYTAVTIGAALITQIFCSIFTTFTILSMMGRGIFCLIVPNVIYALIFFKTSEFKYLQSVATGMLD